MGPLTDPLPYTTLPYCCSEALIRLVQRALLLAIGESILTTEAANLINEMSIGYKLGADANLNFYWCPNDFILGRTEMDVPQDPFEFNFQFKSIQLSDIQVQPGKSAKEKKFSKQPDTVITSSFDRLAVFLTRTMT